MDKILENISPLMRFDQDYQTDLTNRMVRKEITVAEYQETMGFHTHFIKNEIAKMVKGEALTNIDDMRIALDFLLHTRTFDEKDKTDIQEMAYGIRKELDNMIKERIL